MSPSGHAQPLDLIIAECRHLRGKRTLNEARKGGLSKGALGQEQTLRYPASYIISRRFVQLLEKRELMFNPELCAGLLDQSLDSIHRRQGQVPVNIELRNTPILATYRKVVEVAGEHDRTAVCQVDEQNLVPRGVARC